MGDEKAVFDADVSGFLRAIAKQEEGLARVRKSLKDTSKSAKEGADIAIRQYVAQIRAEDVLLAKKKMLETALKNEILAYKGSTQAKKDNVEASQALQHAANRNNMIISQLSFAVDDFATVVGTTGLAGGLRAAANNLSMVAAQFHPMLVMVPAIAAALVGFATGTKKAANNTDELTKKIDAATAAQEKYKKTIEGLQDTEDELLDPEKAKLNKEAKEIQEAKAAVQGELTKNEVELQKKRTKIAELEKPLPGVPGTRVIGEDRKRKEEARVIKESIGPEVHNISKAKDQLKEIEDRESRVNDIKRAEKIREIGRNQIEDEYKDLEGETTAKRFTLNDYEIAAKKKQVEAKSNEAEDARKAAMMPNSPGKRNITDKGKNNEQDIIDSLNAQREVLQRQLQVLEKMKEDADRDRKFDNGLNLNRPAGEAAA